MDGAPGDFGHGWTTVLVDAYLALACEVGDCPFTKGFPVEKGSPRRGGAGIVAANGT